MNNVTVKIGGTPDDEGKQQRLAAKIEASLKRQRVLIGTDFGSVYLRGIQQDMNTRLN